ncbi:MAG: ABC transporter permease [Bacteroidota bacterium]
MLKNYLKVAYRGLLKNKGASIINITGLAVGMASCILIYLFVKQETSYDAFHSKSDRIFRAYTIDQALGVSSNKVGITMPMMGPTINDVLPEVELSTRMINQGNTLVTVGDHNLYAENAKSVDSSFFEIFDYELLVGEPGKVLSKPRTAVVTQSMAERTFGSEDPIGRTINVDNSDEWEVVGVMKDLENPSHLDFDLLLALYPTEQDSGLVNWLGTWGGLGMVNYIQLDDASSKDKVEAEMKRIALENEVPEVWIPQLQPLEDVHLQSADILFDRYNANKSDIAYIHTLTAVAVFIILIAAFNFMNLTTAKSPGRAKEVGVRKVMGAFKMSLVKQHLSESILMCFISLLLALVLITVFGPMINLGFNGDVLGYITSDPLILITIVAATLILGVFSGSYPAFILSRFHPVSILRGKFMGSKSGILLRKVLVIAQFAASVAMIIGTVLVYEQLQYIKNKNLGFNKDQIVNFQMTDASMREGMEVFRDKLLQHQGVVAAATSSNMPGRTFGRTGIQPEGTNDEQNWIVSVFSINEAYFDLMGMEIVAGRNYDQASGTDQQEGLIVNEALLEQVGWQDGVGKKITFGNNERTIVGVVKDFHFASMRHTIEPLVIFYNPNTTSNLSVRLNADNITESMTYIENTWSEIYPGHPFEYQFFDEEFAQLFESDELFSALITSFTWLAIFIACLGLFGLASYMIEQRTKEIGVRKVLGARVAQIVVLLSQEFLILILIANFIAWPIAYLAMDNWLADFQYKIDLLSGKGLMIFLASALVTLTIAVLTLSYQSITAALSNPVKALRDE